MEISEAKRREIIAYEAFVRRAAEVNMPFMLKGSYVTRQYFPPDVLRVPGDLDWVYLEHIDDTVQAQKIFDKWATDITTLDLNDGVKFRSFKENPFWRSLDYAMADDFPTVNTDLDCWVDGQPVDLSIDITFNLEVSDTPVPLLFRPLRGEGFTVPLTVPLSPQVAWKIHQTLVRPRLKDLLDLTYLVQHVDFTKEVLDQALKTLVAECRRDRMNPQLLWYFLEMDVAVFFVDPLEQHWHNWRTGEPIEGKYGGYDIERVAKWITDETLLPETLEEFLGQFRNAMGKAGFGVHLAAQMGLPERVYPTAPIEERVENPGYIDVPNRLKDKTDEELMQISDRQYLTGETPYSTKPLFPDKKSRNTRKTFWDYVRDFFKE